MSILRAVALALLVATAAGCATAPPRQTENICEIFDEYPKWYDYAKASEKKWGTPVNIQMAFVHQESRFVSNARPPFEWFLFIPKGRASSARGYAQIQDPAWQDYTDDQGRLFKSRSNMKDALDFIGWYNDISRRRLGIPLNDPRNLYLAYHEGHGGYSRASYRSKPNLQQVAVKVENVARNYGEQLQGCEKRFRCRRWYQFGPFCR
jgi:hypothetical protein